MENTKGNGDLKEESKDTRNYLFSREPENESRRNKLDVMSDSKEDMEAIPADDELQADNVYQNLRGNRANGYMRDGETVSESSKINEDELGKLNISNEDDKNNKPNTHRAHKPQRGESGMHFDAGTIDSPHSEVDMNKNKNGVKISSSLKSGGKKSQGSKEDHKDDLGWNEENKHKASQEDGKHDEEKSLLDPGDDNDIYSKDVSKNLEGEDDRDMRRSSTKPERPVRSKNKSKDDSKSKDEDIEEKPKEMSAFQKKCIAFLDCWQWGIFMTVITIYTLFFDDIRV